MNTATDEVETVTLLRGTNTLYLTTQITTTKVTLKTKLSIKYTSNLILLHMPILSN